MYITILRQLDNTFTNEYVYMLHNDEIIITF